MSRLLKQQVVGKHVRRLRKKAGLSLRELASRAGFSPSLLSQLENGIVSPSIHSMEKISGVLGVTLAAFFAGVGKSKGPLVTRVRERRHLASWWSKAEIEALGTANSPQGLESLLITLRPGGRSGKHPVPHQTEEFALVLKGKVTLRLGPDEYRLARGDAVSLRPRELRLWTNEEKVDCCFLVVARR
jgi:transcriptional regulator with XRE-family HTH domain